MRRALILSVVVSAALAASRASAQLLTSPLLPTPGPGIGTAANLGQLQTMMLMRASVGGGHGVQTGVNQPFINGYGQPPMDTGSQSYSPSSSAPQKGKKRSLEDIKAAVRAKHERERLANHKPKDPKKNVANAK